MPTIRFRIRSIMVTIALAAGLMGLLRWSHPIYNLVMSFVVLVGPFALYGWFLQSLSRRVSRSQSPIPEASADQPLCEAWTRAFLRSSPSGNLPCTRPSSRSRSVG